MASRDTQGVSDTTTTTTSSISGTGEPRPAVACLRCREQKVRCDRELPSCTRCNKQKLLCGYPAPPDRKRIARDHRTRVTVAKLNDDGGDGVAACATPATPPQASSGSALNPVAKRPRRNSTDEVVASESVGETDEAELPPLEIGTLLLEVYFNRIYNATLLLHKNIALQLYARDAIPSYLLRALFAQAAVFLANVDSPHKQHIKIFPLQTLCEKSWAWARAASQVVLSHVDEPTLLRIQTLQVLQLYYFSQGELQRANVHASLAYQLSQLLNYDQLCDDYESFSQLSYSMRFDREMRRRSFWASWCTMCIAAAPLQLSKGFEAVAHLPLPARFEDGDSVRGVKFELGPTMAPSLEQGANGASACSLMAELVKLLGIWAKVQAFIAEPTGSTYVDREDQLAKVVKLLEPIERTMLLHVKDLDIQTEQCDGGPELFTCLRSLYHLSRLLIHASMVPIFSGHPVESTTSRDCMHKNTRIVLQEATELAKLFKQFLAKGFDVTKLWPCSGCAAFVAGGVLLISQDLGPSVTSTDLFWQDIGPDSKEFKSLQTVLEALSIYWKPLRDSASRLQTAATAGVWQDMDSVISCTCLWYSQRHNNLTKNQRAYQNMPDPFDSSFAIRENQFAGHVTGNLPMHEERDASLPTNRSQSRGSLSGPSALRSQLATRQVAQYIPDINYQASLPLDDLFTNMDAESVGDLTWSIGPLYDRWNMS